MLSYKPLWKTMEKQGITTYTLINKHGINPRTINNLKHDKSITMHTLEMPQGNISPYRRSDLAQILPFPFVGQTINGLPGKIGRIDIYMKNNISQTHVHLLCIHCSKHTFYFQAVISVKQPTPFHLKSKGSSEQAQLFIIRLPLQQTGSFVQDVCCLRIMKYPFCDLLPLQDQRHPVMHRLHGSVCGSRKDHKMLSVFIPSAKPRHKQKRHIVPAKCVLLFPGIPFIKPGCWDHDTPVQYAVPEQRLFQRRLTSGIEDQLFPFIAGKSPALPAAAQGAVFFCQHRRLLPRMDIAGHDPAHSLHRCLFLPFFHLPEQLCNLSGRLIIHIISAAHKSHPFLPAQVSLPYCIFCPVSSRRIPGKSMFFLMPHSISNRQKVSGLTDSQLFLHDLIDQLHIIFQFIYSMPHSFITSMLV